MTGLRELERQQPLAQQVKFDQTAAAADAMDNFEPPATAPTAAPQRKKSVMEKQVIIIQRSSHCYG